MATNYVLKPFRFNLSDLNFMRNQINFRPLYDKDGNAVIAWDGTGTVYDKHGVAYADLGSAEANIAAYGTSYDTVTSAQGLRDPSGMNNNLYLVNATWGAADQPFLQRTQVVFDQYVKPLAADDPNAFYAKKFASSPDPAAADYTKRGDNQATPDVNEALAVQNVVDYTPRMISQLVATAGVTFQTEANSTHLVKDGNGFTQVKDYGMLQSLGQQDAQRPINGDGSASTEYFIGAQNPGVSPVNGWFVLFGQFFDHGLDFVGKGGDGTKITINLAPDDPLYGVIDPTTGQPASRIVIARADVSGYTADGTPQWVNHTSPYIDQSQTYGSQEQVTALLREWVSTDGNKTYHAGSRMLDGNTSVAWTNAFGESTHATLPTLNELRAHLLATHRDGLNWEDVLNLRNRDASGHVTTGSSGQALILDMNPRFDEAHFKNPLNPDAATKFQTDIATLKAAAQALGSGYDFSYIDGAGANDGYLELKLPAGAMGPDSPAMTLTGASALALWVNFGDFSIKASMQTGPDTYVNLTPEVRAAVGDLLMAAVGDHYIAGDGRVNENIGLTAVHHVWHEEHNFQVRNIQDAILAEDARQERLDEAGTYNHDLLREWQLNTGTQDADGNYLNADGSIAWDEEKLFNAAKITVEMEYQHTAVDQFARTITPNIAEFVGYNSGEQADVSLDFSQVAYRFGHSTLRESIDTIDPNGSITGAVMRVALERAFLSPELFAQKGAAAIALGMTHQQANEIDEFVTPALNQGLLGMPLDLAAINIARGRDLGIPTLNEFRKAIGLTEYTSWADFGANMIHPDNLVNFIAAYSFDGNVERAAAIIGLENGTIAEGTDAAMGYTYQQALNFLQNTDPTLYGADGFQHIDTWIGGLAEVHVTGGLLGETFDTVFADQISRLMNGDRFYYLYRLDKLQMGEGIINEQFKDIVERNTGAEHLNGSVFAYADKYYDLSENEVINAKTEHKFADALAANPKLGIYSTKGSATTGNGDVVILNGVQYIRDLRVEDSAATSGTTPINGGLNLDGTPNSGAESHEVIVATDRNDLIYGWGGDDTLYGEGGDDILNGGNGIDRIYGGDGADRILGGDGGDLLDGGAGDDYVSGEQSAIAAAGVDQVIGGEGNDILHSGVGIDKLSGEAGDDFIFGEGDTDAFTHGGDGNDIIDGGIGGDLLWGDGGDDLIIGGDDQDISAGLDGDDILRPGPFSQAMGGGPDEVMGGDGRFDLGNDGKGVGFDLIDFSDHAYSPQGILIDFATQQNPMVAIDRTTPFPAWWGIEGVVASQSNDVILADANGNWLIGGSGNDRMTGAGGNDVIVGDGIRLDSLIGTYAGGYGNYLDGASNRAAGFVQNNGLLDAVGPGFEKHFTQMLSSATFKDLELGGSQVTRLWRNGAAGSDLADSVTVGDGGTAGSADTVVFTGNRADYDVTLISFATQNQGTIQAFILTDRTPGRDGTDVVVGVEKFQFADQMMDAAQLINHAPTGSVGFTGLDATTVARLTPESKLFDADNIGPGNPDGAVTIPASGYNWQVSADGGTTWTSIAVGTGNNQQNAATHILSYTTTPGTLVRVQASYTDALGKAETVSSPAWNLIVGTRTTVNATGNNVLNGTASLTIGDVIFGLSGRDTINGNDGNDFLYGGADNDTLNGGLGNDTVDGGAGDDILLAAAGDGDDAYIGGTGTDTYNLSASSTGATINLTTGIASSADTGSDTLSGIESVVGGSGADVIADAVGANRLEGAGGNDTFVLLGDDVRDTVIGGAGGDTADYSAATANLTVSLASTNAVVTGSGTVSAQSDTLSSVENFIGGSGNDTITGSAAANQLSGGAGADRLVGGAGADNLTGGLGADVFAYNAISESGVGAGVRDLITDFLSGTDKLDFSSIDARTTAFGNNAFTFNATAGSQFTGAGQLIFHYETIGGTEFTVIEGNVNANLAADFQVALVGHINLQATDIIA